MHPGMKAAMADKYRSLADRPDDMEAMLRGGDDPPRFCFGMFSAVYAPGVLAALIAALRTSRVPI